ncbi:16387_t:CDS:2 [Dentiscutata heterogama]|uniref:16387_t:CDS:1 n=1 Tax=Dentiscutata heterogama TaxID=1316150 RepID=A0ACA9LWA7_9GLOM|nr:16387_t:CDS:2 [Dentiscutata heterogama]
MAENSINPEILKVMTQSNYTSQHPYRRSSEPTPLESSIFRRESESTGIQRRTSETLTTSNSMAARKYAVYKSHLHDYSILEDAETANNVINNSNNQPARWTVSETQLPPRISSLSHLQERIISPQGTHQTNSTKFTQKSKIPISTGIDNRSVIATQIQSARTSLERKHKQSARTSLERKPSQVIRNSLERRPAIRASSERRRTHKLVGRTQSKRTVVKRNATISKRKNSRKKLILEVSTTSNQTYANDPTDMDADLPPLKNKKIPWLPGPQRSPKLLHASLVPLPNHSEGVSNNSNSHSYNVTSSHLSVASRILRSCRPKYVSSIFMSTDLTLTSNAKSRQEKRDSVTIPVHLGNRASQIFRRQLLEQSLYMSFCGGMPTNQIKPSKRRKARKGYSVKIKDRDREARREKRRKERKDKLLANAHKIDDKERQNMNSVNPVVIPKILDSEELIKKVEEQLRKREYLMSPPPPPRYKNQQENQMSGLSPVQRSKSNSSNVSSLFSNLPERRRSDRSNDLNNQMLDSIEPFPTHLTSQRKDRLPHSNTVFVQPPTILMSTDEIIHDFESPQIEKQVESTEKKSADNSNSGTPLSPLSPSSPSIYNKFGSGLLSLFNRGFHRDANSSSISGASSPTTPNYPLSPRSPLSPNSPSSPVSPRQFSVSQNPFKNPGETLHSASQSSRTGFSKQSTESTSKKAIQLSTTDLSAQSFRPGNFRRATEPVIKRTHLSTTVTDPEKLRKMQTLEEILALSDAENERKAQTFENLMNYGDQDGKKLRVGKSRTLKTAVITSTTAMTSPSVIPVEPITDSDYYEDEPETLGPQRGLLSNDGVIRLTLTPAICR